MKNVSMGNILPGIICNVERRQGGVIQMFLPNALPPFRSARKRTR
jgi:hypothetical protein